MPSMDTVSRELMLDSLRNYAKKNLSHEFLREMVKFKLFRFYNPEASRPGKTSRGQKPQDAQS